MRFSKTWEEAIKTQASPEDSVEVTKLTDKEKLKAESLVLMENWKTQEMGLILRTSENLWWSQSQTKAKILVWLKTTFQVTLVWGSSSKEIHTSTIWSARQNSSLVSTKIEGCQTGKGLTEYWVRKLRKVFPEWQTIVEILLIQKGLDQGPRSLELLRLIQLWKKSRTRAWTRCSSGE